MRVVLDTNILISACLKPDGNEASVLALTRTGAVKACVSAPLVAEYREVAERGKFAKFQTELNTAIGLLLAAAEMVAAVRVCNVCADPDDNILLDCALAGRAQFVVTGNLRDFPQQWNGIRVVNARELLGL